MHSRVYVSHSRSLISQRRVAEPSAASPGVAVSTHTRGPPYPLLPARFRWSVSDRLEGWIRLLDLGKNGIGLGGSGRQGRALIQHASAFTHLDLARNQLRAQGADMLASAIGQCASLTHLDLSFNKMGGQAAGRLTGQLRPCEKLACLKLRGNQIVAVGQALSQPRMLWLGAPLSRTSIWPTISWATLAARACRPSFTRAHASFV